MVRLNEYGYCGSVLTCDSCGRDVIVCNGSKWKILSCTKKGHKIAERISKPKSYLCETYHTVEGLRFVNEAFIEKSMSFEDVIRGSQR